MIKERIAAAAYIAPEHPWLAPASAPLAVIFPILVYFPRAHSVVR